jgi:flagellar biogenesis protein FliO
MTNKQEDEMIEALQKISYHLGSIAYMLGGFFVILTIILSLHYLLK